MRGLRSLIVLVLIAIPIGWFTWRESQRPAGDDTPAKGKVFAVEADQIQEIAITSPSGDETRLQKDGDKGWQIVAPVAADPDVSEVASLTSSLSSLEIQRVVDENPPNLEEYGLAEPRLRVTFKTGSGEHALLVGGKTPPGTDLYAKRGSDASVFLIPSYLESTFDKGTFDLRDKSVVKVDREKLDAIEVTAGGRTLRFGKAGDEWQIAAPLQARGDFSTIEGLVSRLSGLQMKAVVDEAEAAKVSFEKPAATAKLGTGSSQATVVIGGEAAEGTVYARDLSRPLVFTIDSSILEELKKDLSEYRQKDLFDARSFNATRLEVTRGGETHVFEKATAKNAEGQDEQKWRQLAPQARDLDGPAFDTLLSAITGVRATTFVDDAAAKKALASPELTALVRFDDGKKEERVTFARAGSDAYASRAGDPGAAKIEASALDSIVKALQELK